MQGFFDFVKSLGAARMAAMAAVTLALIGFFSFLMVRMTTPQMVPLFTDLSMDDSASIIKDLERQGVTYEIRNDGSAIHETAKDKLEEIARARGFEGRLMVMADDSLVPDDCRIEWADGGICRDEAATRAVIDDVVSRYVAARTPATN